MKPSGDIEAQAAGLEVALAALEEEYAEKRKRLTGAIAILRGESIGGVAAAKPPTTSSRVVSRLEAADEAISSFQGRFSTTDVRQYIIKGFPALRAQLHKTYLTNRLYALEKAGKIKLIEKGKEGAPNIWSKV